MTSASGLAHRRGEYGVDAPYVPLFLGIGGLLLSLVALLAALGGVGWGAAIAAVYAAWLLLSTASYRYTTRWGKFAVWADLLRQLGPRGDERVLDLGCGRGAVLLMVAQVLPRGTAVGVDLWKSADQSGNDPAVTRRNAAREGVAERVRLATADMRALPFADGSFDVVLASLALHNITSAEGRAQVIDEALRVLKPGGRLLIVDVRATAEYVARLRQRGLGEIVHQRLDWRLWYGGPWAASRLVAVSRPVALIEGSDHAQRSDER